jgi:hypothetical protein
LSDAVLNVEEMKLLCFVMLKLPIEAEPSNKGKSAQTLDQFFLKNTMA